ncbi:MAG: DUF3343 domain-containing protein [Candidatus Cloacimonetes bacterium]|jgi:hypothetical protein|nr:DUF3343 domain-containing protein [Candidatus Cloacimonadota bacterium]
MKLLVFDTTHHALWAEEIARNKGLAVDVVPAPPEADARCDLALAFLEEDELELIASLDAAGVPFRLHMR